MFVSEVPSSEFSPFYANYIKKAGTSSLLSGLGQGMENTAAFFRSIPENKLEYRYSDGKWTIKEIIQHLIDTEHIFIYRALRFARQDKTPLPGFEQDDYVLSSVANRRTRDQLINDYMDLRESTIALFSSFSKKMLEQIGEASGADMSVRAIGFILVGHEKHHIDIIKERYL
ncbi:DinB family protein [Bizionia argentinensis JUB59]|uniref:DinB family protein n=1 Tax=Bizionia argentinensis JUB59 TaxID=1046627 RepID=G2E997_9FLAO|nr:DinB family protein [Bizionia argentinensis]EGV44960.1 DinB family protein [Bizionia argentinensis JUB59]